MFVLYSIIHLYYYLKSKYNNNKLQCKQIILKIIEKYLLNKEEI